ncbi:MAG: nitroreductase family protein [Desulfobacteraceae bacterium]|jgi:SagB-type dehydrogenase family enzyme
MVGFIRCTITIKFYKLLLLSLFMLAIPCNVVGQSSELKAVKLNRPNLKRGLSFMETLSVKASARKWSDRDLSLQDLSDLLWAANGINRPDERKYTASSAQNAHDVDLYLFMKDGVYLYNSDRHALEPVIPGDFRSQIMMKPPHKPKNISEKPKRPQPVSSTPPIQIILISDSSRFKMGPQELRYEWGAIDTGIVSQNISLFCAATGIKTRPRASMDKEKIKKLLKLDDNQYVLLNHPVGYSK